MESFFGTSSKRASREWPEQIAPPSSLSAVSPESTLLSNPIRRYPFTSAVSKFVVIQTLSATVQIFPASSFNNTFSASLTSLIDAKCPLPASASQGSSEFLMLSIPRPIQVSCIPCLLSAVIVSFSSSRATAPSLMSPSVISTILLLPPSIHCCRATWYASLSPLIPGDGPSAHKPSTAG